MAKNKASNHYLFSHGNHFSLYNYFGAHKKRGDDGIIYTVFRVWAPDADNVFVIGDFNGWKETCQMKKSTDGGIWQISVPLDFSNQDRMRYKYLIFNKDAISVKADPFAFYGEISDDGASYLYEHTPVELDDSVWLASRVKNKNVNSALNIYELDPGTFYRNRGGSFMDYSALADRIAPYVKKMGFTHIKMPVYTRCESQGKISEGRFSVDSRFGSPKDLLNFIAKIHRYSLGVIFDIPLLKFNESESGLNDFDGSNVYEHRQKDGDGTARYFDTSKNEVVSFLISSVLYFIREYHADGICIDLSDSSSSDGGYRSKAAVSLIKKLNRIISDKYPDVLLLCESGASRSALTKPLFAGGSGFDYLINTDRADGIDAAASGIIPKTAISGKFDENYVSAVRPSEYLLNNRFNDIHDKIAFYRTYLLYNICVPGKKSVFSGCEFADFDGRKTTDPVNWFNASSDLNSKALVFSSDLNYFYLNSPELWKLDSGWNGFKPLKNEQGLTAFIRSGTIGFILCVFNFTAEPVRNAVIGVPNPGFYSEIFTTRSSSYGGEGGLSLPVRAKSTPADGCDCSLAVDIPPYTGSVYKSESMIIK